MLGRTLSTGAVVLGAAFAVWLAVRDGGTGSGGTAVAARADDTHARVDACLAARQKVTARRAERGGPSPAGEPTDGAVAAAACAPLFHEAACRDAQLHFDDPAPAERAAAVLEACKRAYCGKLGAPLPRACDASQPPPGDGLETFTVWDDLRRAILRHDIGDAEAARLDER